MITALADLLSEAAASFAGALLGGVSGTEVADTTADVYSEDDVVYIFSENEGATSQSTRSWRQFRAFLFQPGRRTAQRKMRRRFFGGL